MRYGTLPIAHATGGLNDTITRHNPYASDDVNVAVVAAAQGRDNGDFEAADLGPGTGWLFNDMTPWAMMSCITNAVKVYHENPKLWRAMQVQAMSQDLSWYHAALKWEKVFGWAKIDPPSLPTRGAPPRMVRAGGCDGTDRESTRDRREPKPNRRLV